MNELFAAIILFGISIVWFGLPLLPTASELRKRAAAGPLDVDRTNDGEIRHFAKRFKSYLESNFRGPGFRDVVRQGLAKSGTLADGTPYRIVAKNDFSFLSSARKRSIPGIIVFSGPAVLPGNLEFVHGVYAAADIECGTWTLLRSLYGEHDVRLRQGTVILRWIHVDNELVVERNCSLYGRASAEQSMRIGGGAEFERLHARRIMFEFEDSQASVPKNASPDVRLTFQDLGARLMAENCYSVDKDLEIPSGAAIRGDFVVRGAVRIGGNARLEGSIKSRQDMSIEQGAVIEGSVISGGELDIRKNCRVRGPAVAGRLMTIRGGCQVGAEDHPTSVIAPSIFVHPGVLAFGALWAREHGKVGG